MGKEISAIELQQKLSEFLDAVHQNGDRLIVKRADKPLAAIVPFRVYERVFNRQEDAFSVLDKIWAKVPRVSEEEVQTDIEQALTEVRSNKTLEKSGSS